LFLNVVPTLALHDLKQIDGLDRYLRGEGTEGDQDRDLGLDILGKIILNWILSVGEGERIRLN
jgi:hypothetical protein